MKHTFEPPRALRLGTEESTTELKINSRSSFIMQICGLLLKMPRSVGLKIGLQDLVVSKSILAFIARGTRTKSLLSPHQTFHMNSSTCAPCVSCLAGEAFCKRRQQQGCTTRFDLLPVRNRSLKRNKVNLVLISA